MNPEAFTQVEQLYHALVTLNPEQRAARLAAVSDALVRREVERLLSANAQTGDFLQSPVAVVPDLLDTVPLPRSSERILGHYRLQSLLGKGGMGEVYLAEDTRLQRKVALKLLPAAFTSDADRVRRFAREAKAASALNHPNILTIHEIGHEQNTHYIATEFIAGSTLRQRLTEARLPLRTALDIAVQTASALVAAHEAGIVHRDIKPENVMLRSDGLVKVLDFGLAKLTEVRNAKHGALDEEADTLVQADQPNMQVTDPGAIMGTASYMSPEQARGQEVDARSDIFSFGVLLYEMVTGRAPFAGVNPVDVLGAILNQEPAPLHQYAANIPNELLRIISKALRKDRDERYQDSKDLWLDLKELKEDLDYQARQGRGQQVSTEADCVVAETTVSQATVPSHTTTSSAKIIFGEIKQHKTGLALSLVALLMVLSFATYFLFFARRYTDAINSIAVLPFANGSDDQNLEYLSDGLSESLIDRLAQLPQLKVIARQSAFKYKGKEIDAQEVAQALGVQAIITGRVAQHGDSLMVHAELINARDKTQLWGEQYQRKAADLLTVQAEISQEIATRLRARLSEGERQQLTRHETTNSQAYELVLKGNFTREKDDTEARKRALEYYHQALTLDPDYALAQAQLARCYISLVISGVLSPSQARPQAEAAARRAIALDDTLPQAHLALAEIETYNWKWSAVQREFQRALALNPNLAEAHNRYAVYLDVMGEYEQAVAESRRALSLDPFSVRARLNIGFWHLSARKYDQAIAALQETIAFAPTYGDAHLLLGYVYAAQERYPEAIALYEKAIQLGDQSTSTQIYLGYALARGGQRAKAQAIRDELQTTKRYVSPAEMAILYLGLDARERALSLLEQAYTEHDFQIQFLNKDPHYDSVRTDPRFQRLVRGVGLP